MVAAATVHLLRAPRLRALPALALVVGTVWMTGSHNITLVWGSLTLALLAIVAIIALPRHGRELAPRRIAAVLGLATLSAAVNAWFLLPDLSYAGKVRASLWGYDLLKGNGKPLNSLANIFNPIYHDPIDGGIANLYVQLPVLALLWALIVVLTWRRDAAAGPWRRAMAGLLAVFAGLIVLIIGDATWVWSLVPEPLRFVQFPHRLHAYTVLLTSGFVLVALAGSARTRTPERSRGALTSLAAVCLLLMGVGTWQIWSTKDSLPNRQAVFAAPVTRPPATWYDAGAYRDISEPVVETAPSRRADFPIAPTPGRARRARGARAASGRRSAPKSSAKRTQRG